MSLRIPPVALSLLPLFFSASVIAGPVNVTANCTLPSYFWTFNSVGQSPCTVAGYMLSTCIPASVVLVLSQLPPGGTWLGPVSHESSNKCQCNTVVYSLLSACIECQQGNPIGWSSYTANCTITLPVSAYPNPVPAGIYVPHWALLDVTNENFWNSNESYAAGDTPEYGPGAILGSSGVSTSTASAPTTSTSSASASITSTFSASISSLGKPSSSASLTAPPTPSHSGVHVGVIAGGAVGGISMISITIAAIFYLRRRRSQAVSAGVGASQRMSNDETILQTSSGAPLTMKLYDPNDPTTFPGYQGDPQSLDNPSGSGSTLAEMQTSSHNKGYRGLPMPST